MITKRFLSLIAVSSEPQAGDDKASLGNQRMIVGREIDRWRSSYDCIHVAEIEVPGHSRDYSSIEEAIAGGLSQYVALRDYIKSDPKQIDVLIFYNYSRLGRDVGLIMNIVSLCQRYKIVVYGCDMPPNTLEFQRNMMALFASAYGGVGAHGEKEQIKDRHDTGMRKRVENGNFPHKPPWGWLERYDTSGEKPALVVDVDERAAATIRLIFDMYLNRGMGGPGIASELNRLGIAAPESSAWGETGVRWILCRAWLFAGHVELNRTGKSGRQYIRAKSKWPAIVSEEIAYAVDVERARRLNARRSVGSKHLFSQMVFCVPCQRLMIAKWSFHDKKFKNGTTRRYHQEYYICRKHGKIAASKVLRAVRVLLSSEQAQDALLESAIDSEVNTADIDAEISSYQKEIDELEQSLNQAAVDYYVERRLPQPQFAAVEQRIKQRKEAASAQITALQNQRLNAERQNQSRSKADQLFLYGPSIIDASDVVLANNELRRVLRILVEDHQVVGFRLAS